MLLLLLLCILPQMNGTARAEDEEPHLISWTFDYDITTCGVFMEFVDEDGTCGDYDAIRENYVAPGQTVTLPADSEATTAVIWLKTENAPYMTVGVNEGATYEGFMMSGDMLESHSNETVRILGPYEEKYYAVNEMILTDIHEDMIYTISILPTEEAYDEYLLYNLPGGLEIVSLVCNVPFEPVPSTDINIFRKIDFYDEMCYLIIPDGNDDREMSFLLYPEEGQEIIDCSYSVAKGLKVLDNNVYSITLPVKSDFLSFRNCCSFSDSNPQISISTPYEEDFSGTVSCGDSSFNLDLTYSDDYFPYSNLDSLNDPVTLTLSANGAEIRGLIVSSGGKEEYVHGNGTDEITYSFVPADYPGGIRIAANPDNCCFDSHYTIDYDYPGSIYATDSHGNSQPLTYDPSEYDPGETIIFTCYDYDDIEVTPYRVDIYDHTTNEITTLYASDFEGNTFTYTPTGEYGFHIRLYCSMQEWEYYNYEEYIDSDAHAAGIFDMLYKKLDLSLYGCNLVEWPTEYPYINTITYGETTLIFIANDSDYFQFDTEEEPLFHFAVLPNDDCEYMDYFIPCSDEGPVLNSENGTYEFGMYNFPGNDSAEIFFYGDEEPIGPIEEPWNYYGHFMVMDSDRFDITATINGIPTPLESGVWIPVPMNEDGSYADVTLTYRPFDGNEYPAVINGLQLFYGEYGIYDFIENNSGNPYEFTFTTNCFEDGVEICVPSESIPVNNELIITAPNHPAPDHSVPVTVQTDLHSQPVTVKYNKKFHYTEDETLYFRFLCPNDELPFMIVCYPTNSIQSDYIQCFDREDFVDGYLPFTPNLYGYELYVYYTPDDYYIQWPNELPLFSEMGGFNASTVHITSNAAEPVKLPSDFDAYATSLHSGELTAVYFYTDEAYCGTDLAYGFRIDGNVEDYQFSLDWELIPSEAISVVDDIAYITCPYDMYDHYITVSEICSLVGCSGEISEETESFDLQFYIDLLTGNPGDYTVKAFYSNLDAEIKECPLEECSYEYDGYVFPVGIYAKYLAEDVTVEIYKGNDIVSSETYSYAKYLTEILDEEDMSDYHEIAKAMLNYGAATQNYFDCNTDHLANAELDNADKVLGEVPDLSDYMVNASGESELGFSLYGYSLTLKDRLFMNLYFECPEEFTSEEQLGIVNVECDNNDFTYCCKDGHMVISAPFGWFDPWDEPATITVDGIEVKCTPLGYLYSAMESTANDDLKTVCNAIYNLYNACAELQ